MMSSSTAQSAPFAQAVVSAMRKLYVNSTFYNPTDPFFRYPESLADKSFDNTGRMFSNYPLSFVYTVLIISEKFFSRPLTGRV